MGEENAQALASPLTSDFEVQSANCHFTLPKITHLSAEWFCIHSVLGLQF